MSPKYEVSWQVFGSRVVDSANREGAEEQVHEWLEEEHNMTSQVADGWDYEVALVDQ